MAAKTKKKNQEPSELEDVLQADQPDDKNIDKQDEKKEAKKQAKDKKKKKGKFPIVPVIVLLIIIGAIVAVLAFNVFGIREEYIMPYLRNAPLIGNLLPPPSGGESAENALSGKTQEELIDQITMLEYEAERLGAELETAAAQNTEDKEVIANLRRYELLMDEYYVAKEDFDAMIARGDPDGYAEFFELVSPENAERLYQEIVADRQFSNEQKSNANRIANMKPAEAALVLEQLLLTDSEMVVRLIGDIDDLIVADIYSEMDPANAAALTRLLEPTPMPEAAASTAPPLATPEPVNTEAETSAATTEAPVSSEPAQQP